MREHYMTYQFKLFSSRPREISSKIPQKKFAQQSAPVIPVQKNIPRDPRFDSLCGTFKEKVSFDCSADKKLF